MLRGGSKSRAVRAESSHIYTVQSHMWTDSRLQADHIHIQTISSHKQTEDREARGAAQDRGIYTRFAVAEMEWTKTCTPLLLAVATHFYHLPPWHRHWEKEKADSLDTLFLAKPPPSATQSLDMKA